MEVTKLRTKAVDGRLALIKKSENHHISTSRADMCRAISTKFCLVIEVIRAIILGQKHFRVASIVLALGVV